MTCTVAILAMLGCFPGAVTTFHSSSAWDTRRRPDRSRGRGLDTTGTPGGNHVRSIILPRDSSSLDKRRRREYRLMTWNLLAPGTKLLFLFIVVAL